MEIQIKTLLTSDSWQAPLQIPDIDNNEQKINEIFSLLKGLNFDDCNKIINGVIDKVLAVKYSYKADEQFAEALSGARLQEKVI